MSAFKVNNITKSFKRNGSGIHRVLKDISFSAEQGELLSIIGPTGCGKTTLLRVLCGLDHQDSGSVKFANGNSATSACNLLFQEGTLFPWLTVEDNIAFSLELKKVSKKERREKVKPIIELMGLNGFEKSYPSTISGGMKQRAVLARALIHNSGILLMDEPFAAVDEKTRHRLQDLLLEVKERENKAIILVTHSIDEAIYLGDRILILGGQPSSITKVFDVKMENRRDRSSKEFQELHMKIRNNLESLISG